MALEVKWPVGNRYVQRMEMDQNFAMNLPNLQGVVRQNINQTQEFALSVLEAREEGGRVIEMEYLSQKLEGKMGDQVLIRFDSESDTNRNSNDPMVDTLRQMIGARIILLTDAEGRITAVRDQAEFVENITAGMPAEVKAMFESMFSKEGLQQMGVTPQGLPEEPVAIGDQWTDRRILPMNNLGDLSMNLEYTFAGWEDRDGRRCALLTHAGDIINRGSDSSDGLRMSIEEGTSKGKTWFAPELGMVVENRSIQNMTIIVTTRGRTMTNKISQNMTVETVKAEADSSQQ